jgi:periplasmic protein TonB
MEYYQGSSAPENNNRRIGGFAFVVLLHVLLLWALQSGLARTLVNKVLGPVETKMIDEIKPEEEEPPPPPPKFQAPPPVFVDMPDVTITEAPTTSTITATNAPVRAAPPPPKADVILPPKVNPRNPIQQPEYPTMSRRLGEEGVAILLLTLDADGRVTAATLDTTSGFERLDEAAVKEAVRPRLWRFLPGTVNGKPAPMQFKFAVRFKIDK